MLTRMLQRRGTTAQWEDVKDTLILAAGEVGFVTDGVDANKFKIGDGLTTWTNLEFYLRDDQNEGIYAKLVAAQTFQGSQVLTPSTSIVVPLVVSGATSQSADLQRWRDSADNTLASVDATGKLTATGALFNSTVNVNANKVTNVAAPTEAGDATNKQYVDDAIAGLAWKTPVNLISASGLNTYINVPLTGSGGTIVLDGHTALTATHNGYRLLLLAQTTASENGIYVYSQSNGTYTLTRAADSDTYAELKGASVFVEEGTNYGTSSWVQTNHYLTDFSNQQWVQFNGASQITAGTGLTKTGNTINAIGTTDRITANADSIDIASTYVGQSSITTLGTVATGTWNADTIAVNKGGTNITSYTTGDLLYASGTTQLSKLAASTENYVLLSGGTGTAPSWGQIVTSSLANASSTLTGVTYAKMQYVSTQYKLLGRISSGSGVVEELSADDMITMLNTASTNKINTDRLNTLSGGNYGTSTSVAKADHTHAIDDLSDVVITTPSNRQVLKFNGTNWVNELPSGGISVSATAPVGPSSGDAWMDSNDGSLYVYYNDTTSRPAGTNLVTNPTFEVGTTGWTGNFASISQSSKYSYTGTKSGLMTPGVTSTSYAKFLSNTVVGTTYRFSAYVYTETNKNVRLNIDFSSTVGTTVAVPYNTWTRLDVSFTASATTTYLLIESIDSNTPVYIDAVMLEASSTLNDYFDGSSYNATWSGTAHASTSTTAGGTTSQWVQVRANSALEATILTRMSAVESRATNLEAANPVVCGSVAARSALFPSPVQGNTVFRTDLGYMERYYTAYDAVTNPSGTTGTVGWYEYRGGAPLSVNQVLNSAFDVAQRNTTHVNAPSGQFFIDRWYGLRKSATGEINFTRQAIADLPGIKYCARLGRYAGTTSTNYFQFSTSFETIDVMKFQGKTVTVSLYARMGSGTNMTDLTVNLASGTGTDQGYYSTFTGEALVASKNTTLTTSWQRIYATGTVSSTATGLAIVISWNPVGAAGATDYVEITGVQLEEGPVATPFRRNQPNIQAELAACQRYYQVGGAGAIGRWTNSTNAEMFVQFKIPMRANPTPSVISSGNFYNVGLASQTSSFTISTYALTGNGGQFIPVLGTAIGGTTPNTAGLVTDSLGFSAEL